jgi:hypothetical protein
VTFNPASSFQLKAALSQEGWFTPLFCFKSVVLAHAVLLA